MVTHAKEIADNINVVKQSELSITYYAHCKLIKKMYALMYFIKDENHKIILSFLSTHHIFN